MNNHHDNDSKDSVNETRESIQNALNSAREYRDQNIIENTFDDDKNCVHKNNDKKHDSGSIMSTRPQVYYNSNSDVRSVSSRATTVNNNGEYRDEKGRLLHIVAVPHGTTFKSILTAENPKIYNFPHLDYEHIQINLRFLSDISQDEKIHVSDSDKGMSVDNRYLQCARRWWSADSRDKTLAFITHIYNETETLCKDLVDMVEAKEQPKENTEKLINLYGLISSSGRGLDRLNMTYSDDKVVTAKIATIKDTYKTYCDQTLKKTIDGYKQQYDTIY